MGEFNNQWIEIFRAGDYGEKGCWPPARLAQAVTNFRSGAWKAPLVIGHPKDDSPAHGWVSDLELREDGTLAMKASQTTPELEALVRDGRFPNRSAAFYLDPRQSGPVLRHVGFLGATPPEVKGLAPVQFSDGEFVAIEFKEEEDMDAKEMKKTMVETVREYFAELFGQRRDPAPAAFTEADMQKFAADAAKMASAEAAKPLEAKLATLAEENNRLRAGAANSDRKAREVKFDETIARLRKEGRIVPAQDAQVAALRETALAGGMVKFGEGAKAIEVSSFDAVLQFLEGQAQLVPLARVIPAGVKTPKGKVVRFNEAKGITVDMTSVALRERADEIVAEKKISFGEALKLAREEMGDAPQLAGGIAVGQG